MIRERGLPIGGRLDVDELKARGNLDAVRRAGHAPQRNQGDADRNSGDEHQEADEPLQAPV
jgi:hypothetical protein